MNGRAKTLVLGLGIASLGALSACGIGGENIYSSVGEAEPEWDALGIICRSSLEFTGTKTETTPQPEGKTGCWDVGIWTIEAVAVDQVGCDPAPFFRSKYTYEARRDDEDQVDTTITYIPNEQDEFEDVSKLNLNLKITTAGDGLCHGAFSHFYNDRSVVDFYPTAEDDGTLSGFGEFTYYDDFSY